MGTRLIFIRHGFSQSNKDKLFTGQADIPLTELGRHQAECAAQYLKNTNIDKIYASTLSRAVETAQAVAKTHGLSVIKDSGLCEINAGDWTEMPFDKISQDYQAEYNLWKNDMYSCKCPNGESVAEFSKRVYNTVVKIAEENDEKTVCIASHATPIRTICTLALGCEASEIQSVPWSPNASINIIEYENENFHFVKRDIVEHLEGVMTNLPKNI